MKMKTLLKEDRIISPLTWGKFLSIVRYIKENEHAQGAIEGDVKFATQLRKIISKLQTDFEE